MDFFQSRQFAEGLGVTQWDEDHTVVGEGGEHGDDGHFLTTTGTGGDEDTGRLAVESTGGPETTGSVDEGRHLGSGLTESGWDTEDDTVSLLEDVWGGNWVVWLGWGVEQVQDVLWQGFWDLVDGGVVTGGNHTGLHGLGHGGDVVVHGVDDNGNVLGHFWWFCW